MSLPRIIILSTALTCRLYLMRWKTAKQARQNRRCRTINQAMRAAIDARCIAMAQAWQDEDWTGRRES